MTIDHKEQASITSVDDLSSAVRYVLETTHAIAACPFHLDVSFFMGDEAAETHAFIRAKKLVRSDDKTWEGKALRQEFRRQLNEAADGCCPHCTQDKPLR